MTESTRPEATPIFVVSGGVGTSGEQIVRTVLAQFPAADAPVIVVPHVIMFISLAWPWGVWHVGLFVTYSAAVSSTYLALELRLIEGAPFSSQVDATRGAEMLPKMTVGGMAMAVAVGLQYFLVFRLPAVVLASTVALLAAAYILTRWSMEALAVSIRYSLGLLSGESGTLYKEIDN